MHLRPVIPALACAGLLLAALPGGAAASSGGDALTVSHSAAVSAAAGKLRSTGVVVQLPQAKGCQGNDGTYTGTEITSQEFTDLGGFSAVADDFRCSGSRKARTVKKLTWDGSYYGGTGPADSFNVRVYQNDTSGAIDEPGPVQCEFLHQDYTQDPPPPWPFTFTSTLEGKKCVLQKFVTYWLSIQAVMSFGRTGHYGWSQIEETHGNAADFLDSGLLETACTVWANDLTLNDCIDFRGDFIFSFK